MEFWLAFERKVERKRTKDKVQYWIDLTWIELAFFGWIELRIELCRLNWTRLNRLQLLKFDNPFQGLLRFWKTAENFLGRLRRRFFYHSCEEFSFDRTIANWTNWKSNCKLNWTCFWQQKRPSSIQSMSTVLFIGRQSFVQRMSLLMLPCCFMQLRQAKLLLKEQSAFRNLSWLPYATAWLTLFKGWFEVDSNRGWTFLDRGGTFTAHRTF